MNNTTSYAIIIIIQDIVLKLQITHHIVYCLLKVPRSCAIIKKGPQVADYLNIQEDNYLPTFYLNVGYGVFRIIPWGTTFWKNLHSFISAILLHRSCNYGSTDFFIWPQLSWLFLALFNKKEPLCLPVYSWRCSRLCRLPFRLEIAKLHLGTPFCISKLTILWF